MSTGTLISYLFRLILSQFGHSCSISTEKSLFNMKEKQHPFRKFEIKELNFCSTHSVRFFNYKNFRLFVDERNRPLLFYNEVSTSSDKKVTYHCVTVTDELIFSIQPYLSRPEPFFVLSQPPMSVHFWPYFRYCRF